MQKDVVIAIPIHIQDKTHLSQFIQTYSRLLLETSYDWYLDINGCPNFVCEQLQSLFSPAPNITMYFTEKGGRPSALNRSLRMARNQNCKYIMYTNDDLEYSFENLPFEHVLRSLETGIQLVSAISEPADPDFLLDEANRYQYSFSLIAEHYFYNKMLALRGPHFRGDCFGMTTDFIDDFPPEIGGEDLFLAIIFEARFSHRPVAHPEARVTRYQEINILDSIRRFLRYQETRASLIDYFRDNSRYGLASPEYKLAISSIPLASIESTQALLNGEKERLDRASLLQAIQERNFTVAREILGPYANAIICRQTAERFGNQRETRIDQDGVARWSRARV